MSEAIIVALITGGIALIGSVLGFIGSIFIGNKQYEKKQAVIEYKIEELTREVREHNNFAKRVPVVEKEIEHIKHNLDM